MTRRQRYIFPGQTGLDDELGARGAGIAIGVALGVGMGVAIDNISIGVAVGVALGVAIGTGMTRAAENA